MQHGPPNFFSEIPLPVPAQTISSGRVAAAPRLSDEQLRERMESLLRQHPCDYDYPAIRAFLMGEAVAPVAMDPMELCTVFWDEQALVFADAAARNAFHQTFALLWNRLQEHTRKKSPFRLTPLALPGTGAQLEHYLNVRGSEFSSLHAGFLQGRDSSELDDARNALVATLSAGSFVVQRLWGEVYVAAEDDILPRDVVLTVRRFETTANRDVAEFVWKAARLRQSVRS